MKPDGQDPIEKNIEFAETLRFDMQTAQAVRTKSTEVLCAVVADYLSTRIEALLNESLSDERLLALTHEIRGTLKALGEIGDSVRRAHTYIARKTVQERMGVSHKS